MKGYYVGVQLFRVNETRSAGKDTLFLTVRTQAGSQTYPTQIRYEGILEEPEECEHPDVMLGPLPVINTATPVTLSFAVLNTGSTDYTGIVAAFNKVADAAAEKLVATGNIWALVGAGVLKALELLAPILTASCDGPVALDSILRSGAELEYLLPTDGVYIEERRYPGIDSPTGCGDNSDYTVKWALWRSPWSGWLEVPRGGLTDRGLAATKFQKRLYLFAKGIEDDKIYVNSTRTDRDWTGWRQDIPGDMRTDVQLAAAGAPEKLWLFAKDLDDNNISSNNFDGTAWSGWAGVGGTTSSLTPWLCPIAAAPCPSSGFGGPTVALFRRGEGSDDRIYVTVDRSGVLSPSGSGPTSWEPWQEVPGNQRTRGGLASVLFRNRLYLFCLGTVAADGVDDKWIYVNGTSDFASWDGWTSVPGGKTSDATLAVAVLSSQVGFPIDARGVDLHMFNRVSFRDRIHLFVKPEGGKGPIVFSSFPVGDEIASFTPTWAAWQEVPGSGYTESGLPPGHLDRGNTIAGLAAAGHGRKLYLVNKDMKEQIFVNAWDGTQGRFSKITEE